MSKVSFTQQMESVADRGSATRWHAMLDAAWLHLQAQAMSPRAASGQTPETRY